MVFDQSIIISGRLEGVTGGLKTRYIGTLSISCNAFYNTGGTTTNNIGIAVTLNGTIINPGGTFRNANTSAGSQSISVDTVVKTTSNNDIIGCQTQQNSGSNMTLSGAGAGVSFMNVRAIE
jgi:hypothetical protein